MVQTCQMVAKCISSLLVSLILRINENAASLSMKSHGMVQKRNIAVYMSCKWLQCFKHTV